MGAMEASRRTSLPLRSRLGYMFASAGRCRVAGEAGTRIPVRWL
jgi:hypothetical protein